MTAKSITSLSNASLHLFPDNTLTNFVHYLPESIPLATNHRAHIALCRITLSSHLTDGEDKQVGYIKIHLKELNPQTLASDSDGQCLARLPYSAFEKQNDQFATSTYSVPNPVFISLTRIPILSRLSFSITDQYNKPLELSPGPPTVIDCLLDTMQNNFSVTLGPSTSVHLFPENKNMDFRVQFPSPIDLTHDWEVALHSVIVPSGTFVEGDYYVRVLDWHTTTYEKSWSQQMGDTVETVKERISSFLAVHKITITEDGGVLWVNLDADHPYFELVMNAHACQVFGLHTHGKGVQRSFRKTNVLHRLGPFDASFPDTVKLRESILAYCDLVSDSIVGNARAPLLDIIASDALGHFSSQTDTLYSVSNLIFRQLDKPSFQSIWLAFRDLAGRSIKFEKAHDLVPDIQVTLLFRLKQ